MTADTRAEMAFHEALLDAVAVIKAKTSYNPTRFAQMVASKGGAAAAKQLVASQMPSEGFVKLWSLGLLETTAEAHMLLPWFSPLFTDDELEAARNRLEAHDFDVEAFIEASYDTCPTYGHSAERAARASGQSEGGG